MPARRPDPQTDYEDPIDRLYRRRKGRRADGKAADDKPEKTPNTNATVAYYLGMVAIIPCLGLALGPVAIILGVMGLRQTRDPKVSGKGRAKSGIWFGLFACLINYGLIIGFMVLRNSLP